MLRELGFLHMLYTPWTWPFPSWEMNGFANMRSLSTVRIHMRATRERSSQLHSIECSLAVPMSVSQSRSGGQSVYTLFARSFKGMYLGGEIARCSLRIGAGGLLSRDAPAKGLDLLVDNEH